MTIRVGSNRPPARFYRGGSRITTLRGEAPALEFEPEDWVGSTTTIFGETMLGLTRLPDGRLLRDAITDDPVGWLGAQHVARWGSDVRLLVKLLDAGQRLPVHAHPDDDFAARLLGSAHGKAEAWYILEGGTVHLGLRRDVGAGELADLVARQDVDTLLGLLNAFPVSPGDVVWVPPGELHAVGDGILLLELQQPEDLSILLEWDGFAIDGAREGHLGLGFDLALLAVNRRRRMLEAASPLVGHATSGPVLSAAADAFFRLDRYVIDRPITLDEGFAVLLVESGVLDIAGERARKGTTLLLPASDGPVVVGGRGALLVARPPQP